MNHINILFSRLTDNKLRNQPPGNSRFANCIAGPGQPASSWLSWLVAPQIDPNTTIKALRLADHRVCTEHRERGDCVHPAGSKDASSWNTHLYWTSNKNTLRRNKQGRNSPFTIHSMLCDNTKKLIKSLKSTIFLPHFHSRDHKIGAGITINIIYTRRCSYSNPCTSLRQPLIIFVIQYSRQ